MLVPRILVVEDEPFTAIDLREQLINLGFEVPDPVGTGDDALRAVEQFRPNLILMDIKIKGELDGIATAARIPPSYGIPIVYLSAYSDDATMARANATNPRGYLLKPVSGHDLQAMTLLALPRYRARQISRAATEFLPGSEKVRTRGRAAHDAANAVTARQPEEPSNDAGEQSGRGRDGLARMAWRKSDNSLFASVLSRHAGDRYHLIVEQLPARNVWDWAVWRSGDNPDMARHGRASSQARAMEAARAAAGQWISAEPPASTWRPPDHYREAEASGNRISGRASP